MPKKRARSRAGFARLAPQNHPRFFQRLASFFAIARGTRTHNIVPRMRAAAMARNHVVNRQVIRLDTAVLAREMIAAKDRAARECDAQPWPTHLIRQANDRGARNFCSGGANITATIE